MPDMKSKLFPRGGNLVSKSQKDKKMMKKVRKQVGKKPDLFAHTAKKVKKIGAGKKTKKRTKENDDELSDVEVDETQKLPSNAICISTKLANRFAKALCFIRSIDELGMSVTYPGGATGYIKLDQISDKIDEMLRDDVPVDLSALYLVGEPVLTSLSVKRKKSKLHLSLKPAYINANIRVAQLIKGQNIQGTVLSEEDTGFMINIGKDDSKGFIGTDSIGDANLVVGKSTMFTVNDVLLDGRQVVLGVDSQASMAKLSDIDSLLPGCLVDFQIKTNNRQGFGGTVFDFNATMHHSQSSEPLNCKDNEAKLLPARVIYVDHEFKRICVANSTGYMTLAEPAVADRDGEVVNGSVKLSAGGGVLIEFGNDELGWVPRHNLAENRVDDLLSHFPVGREVKGRIIGHMAGEGLHLLTLRESVVEAEFFRYDSFSATQMISGKVCKVNDGGWVSLQIAPHLYGQISPNHTANNRLSKENLEAKYKLGSSHRVMVLDKSSDHLYLTAKPTVMKTKGLKRFTDIDEISVGEISLGTIVYVHTNCVVVQFFNNIKAYVPISQLSHEYIKTIKDNYENGQVVRCRVLEVCPDRENQLIGSLVLEPKEKKKKQEKEETDSIGSSVTVNLDDGLPAASITGTTLKGTKVVFSERDLALDPLVAKTFYHLIRERKVPVDEMVIETKLKDNVRASRIGVLKAAATRGWSHRCGSKLDDMSEGKLLMGSVAKKTEFGFQLQFGGRLRGFLPRSNLVDRFIPDHSSVADIGDTMLAKVTQVNLEKKRFILTTKESEVADIPEYFNNEAVFASYQHEVNGMMDYAGMNIRFGDAVLLKFTIKCEYERAARKTAQVEFVGQATGFTAVVVGGGIKDGTTTTVLGKFIGMSSTKTLLFVKSKLKKTDTSEMIFTGPFVKVINDKGIPAISFCRPCLLARALDAKNGTEVAFTSKTEVNGIHFGIIEKPINLKEGNLAWGISDASKVIIGEVVDGIIYGVNPKGVMICVGNDLVVNCPFGSVTQYFLARDKTMEICKKYFKKGKQVKVEICEKRRRMVQVKMHEEYIDVIAEKMTMSKKRKNELKKDENEHKVKAIKLDIQDDVKEEPKSLMDVADMDLDMEDTVVAEVKRRAVKPTVVDDIVEETTKGLSLEEVEDNAREAERQMEKSKLPEDISGWERSVVSAPNNSEIWLRYSAFHIASGEIAKARLVMERALKMIHFREDVDRLNIWTALLNLEALYGDKESLQAQFNEAKKCNDEKKVYDALVSIQIDSQKFPSAITTLRDAVKKFPEEIDFWVKLGRCQIELGELDKATVTLQRSLQANKAKTHVMITQRFAKLQFEFGDLENGKTILEQMLKVHAKRADIWGVYGDLLLKFGDGDDARRVINRGIEQCSKSRGRLHLMKRMIHVEERIGDEQAAQEWRTKVESEQTKMPTAAKAAE